MTFEIDTSPLPQEIFALGLEDSNFLVPGEQVKARFGIDTNGDTRVVIYVQDIEVQSVDPVSNQMQYKVVGLRQYTQQWDVGGSYLRPEAIDPTGLEIDNG
jgi:hypothetical protein